MNMFEVINNGLIVTDEFKPTIRNALDLSIAKWEFILEHLYATGDKIIDGGETTCGLCQLYSHDEEVRSCPSCPIEIAGNIGCINTPYEDYFYAETLDEHISQRFDDLKDVVLKNGKK